MSIVIAWKTPNYIYMGADSLSTDDVTNWTSKEPKIFLAGRQYIVGSVGCWRFGQLLQHGFEWPTPPDMGVNLSRFMVKTLVSALRKMLKEQGYEKEKEGVANLGGEVAAIIGVQGRLFRLDVDYQIIENDAEFEAIGRGNDMAMGAYEVLSSIQDSDPDYRADMQHILTIVGKHTVGVREPYIVLKQAN